MSKSEQDFKKLMKGLRRFPQNIQKNVMNGAVRSAAVKVQKIAKTNVPKKTGNLKDAIVVRKYTRKAQNRKKEISYKVALTYEREKDQEKSVNKMGIKFITQNAKSSGKADGYYGSMVEFGTRKMKAQPFMRPAARSSAKTSVTTVRNYIATRLPKEAAKIKAG